MKPWTETAGEASELMEKHPMGKLTASIYLTLDGVMEAPEDWLGPYWVPDVDETGLELVRAADALLLGRVTFEQFAAAWPTRDGDFADRINGIQKYVATTTVRDPGWENAEVLSGDVASRVRELKASGQNLLTYGSGRLLRSLMHDGLVDEFWLWVAPLVLGAGSHLFEPDTVRSPLRLGKTRTFESGLVLHSYELAKSG